MTENNKKPSFKQTLTFLLPFLMSKMFWKNVSFIILALLFVTLIIFQGFKIYTNHGEKLRMPNYIDKPLSLVKSDAEDRTFNIEIQDSIMIVGKPGNIVLNQNPKPDAFVKEGRTIYLTITKSKPEMVTMKDLPRFYGENFEIKSQELKIGFQINSEVVGHRYDPGPEGHILAVLHENDTIVTKHFRNNDIQISKGGTLKFILSEKEGGMVPLPDLTCRTYGESRFLLSTFQIDIETNSGASGSEIDNYWIIDQKPPYNPHKNIQMGSTVSVTVSPDKPASCETISENHE